MICKDTGVYVELNELHSYAQAAAKELEIYGRVKMAGASDEITSALKKIKSAVSNLNKRYNGTSVMPEGVEWLLDNWYIADREGQGAANDLRSFKSLPKDRKSGTAVVIAAAASLVESGRGRISEERMSVFLDGFQNAWILSEAELCAFIPAVRAALVVLLKNACETIDNTTVIENVFTSLRFLSGFISDDLLENVNRIETLLRTDPAGVYSRMDEATRGMYRRQISRLAKKTGLTEYDTAKLAIRYSAENKTHIGYYLFKKPLNHEKRKITGAGYVVSGLLISLFITILFGVILDSVFVSLLLFLPVWEMIKNVLDFTASRLVPPARIPRMSLENGIPTEGKTLCIISILLTGKESAERAIRLLEEFSITNADAGQNLNFGLLTDLKESDKAETENDRELIKFATDGIEALNKKHGSRFYLFTRKRTWCESGNCYMGWERKRGAILELIRLLMGKTSGITVQAGYEEKLSGTAYIITLDSDTRLTAGIAVQLVGAAMHPLNRPVISENNIVIDGYGILQPRISVELKSANQSDFTRIFAGQGGIDSYGGSASDIYQDVFGCGSFTGKGLIDVNTYYHCLDNRFPTDTILSHDLLEGAFLGCGYMSDIELVDSCPEKVTSYYERMHRWIRGDWQNCGYLFRNIRINGRCENNPLSHLNKWKIFDNLRRSLTPVFTMTALLAGMLSAWPVFGWVGAVAIFSVMSELFITSAALLFRKNGPMRIKYLSGIITGLGGMLMQTFIRVMLLPYEAWISHSAIVIAMYRLLISKRNLLQWTTAAESDRGANVTILSFYRKMLVCPLVGAVIFGASPYAASGAFGIVWLLTPLYAWALSKQIDRKRNMSEADKRFLILCAGNIWRYFEDFIAPQDNYLPPDNWQEQPANGIAHRTSPTNIGFALLAALAAVDLGLAAKHEAVGMIENLLTTVERLPKWNGHLYNWYDTKTLKVLEPAYVSTVDSGNLAGDLIALKEGLKELGEYRLAEKAERLYYKMSFTPLYDNKRRLFYIGWDAVNNCPTQGYYDLLASEARQTSYIGVARGDVPKKHWQQLSRALVSQNGYLGMASWTGTMFEYLMPHLLLPCYQDSLLYESARFCVYVQKKQRSAPVWGMSESGYYAFDPALNYMYKAHGAQRLALKRNMGADNVISPYSSFMALTIDHKAAIANLKAMRFLGIEGKYGFFEAVDFTPARRGNADFKPVRSFMVHHLGMSLLSVDNVINDGIMQKRFMRDINMAAYSELLQEKIPTGAVVLKKKPREIPEKPTRSIDGWMHRQTKPNMRAPSCCLFSNGDYSVLMNDLGHSRSMCGDIQITRFICEQDTKWRGIDIVINTGDENIPLYYTGDKTIDFASEFSSVKGTVTAKTSDIAASMTVKIPENETGELREVCISRTDKMSFNGTLLVKLTPVLTKTADFESHPIFSKLSLEAWEQNGALIIKRRARDINSEIYLCIASDKPMRFATEGGSLRAGIGVMKRYSTEMNVTAKTELELAGNESVIIKIAVGVAKTADCALEGAQRILLADESVCSNLEQLASKLRLTVKEVEQAMNYISGLIYVTPDRQSMARDILANNNGREGLWQFGISGDVPVLLADIEDESRLEAALTLVRQHCLLTESGLRFDLVLGINDKGDYRMTVKQAVLNELLRLGRENRFGVCNGVHLIEKTDNIKAYASKIIDLTGGKI